MKVYIYLEKKEMTYTNNFISFTIGSKRYKIFGFTTDKNISMRSRELLQKKYFCIEKKMDINEYNIFKLDYRRYEIIDITIRSKELNLILPIPRFLHSIISEGWIDLLQLNKFTEEQMNTISTIKKPYSDALSLYGFKDYIIYDGINARQYFGISLTDDIYHPDELSILLNYLINPRMF